MYYSLHSKHPIAIAHVYYIEILQLIANRIAIMLVCYLAQTKTVIALIALYTVIALIALYTVIALIALYTVIALIALYTVIALIALYWPTLTNRNATTLVCYLAQSKTVIALISKHYITNCYNCSYNHSLSESFSAGY